MTRVPYWLAATGPGLVVAVLVAFLPRTWPTLAVGSGAIATIVVQAALGRTRTNFAAAGTAFCLLLAVLAVTPPLETAFGQSMSVVLATLGAVSATLVGARYAVGVLLRRAYVRAVRAGRRSQIDAIRSIASALGLLRTLLGLLGRATRIGLVVVVALGVVVLAGTAGFVLDGLGVDQQVPWLLVDGVHVAHVLFVGALLATFVVVEFARSTLLATTESVHTGRAAGSRLSDAIRDR